MKRALLIGAALVASACDDGGSPALELEVDAAPAPVDAAPPAPDAAAPDAAPEDAGPPPHLDAPLAWIYVDDPVTDEGELTQVALARTDHADGRLTNHAVEVFNCLNEEGGVVATPDLGGLMLTVSLCHEVQVARPDADGNYLSIVPPADESDPNDSFAEVMMYHQVTRARDYFFERFGFTDLDISLPALVNVQLKVEPPLSLGPFRPNADGWYPLANAAFFPKEQWDLFASQFGLPPRDSDSIIFFQDQKDFAYDARVIFHEYTHAVIGFDRLSAQRVVDRYGLNPSTFSMHEGLADYFAATLADDAVIGRYVGQGGSGIRDISDRKKCPDDVVAESHANGQIIGSTLWAVRQRLGAEVTDQIVYRALEQFTQTTTFEEAAALMIAEAEAMDPGLVEPLRAVFAESNFEICERSAPWVDFDVDRVWHRLPYTVEGSQSVGIAGFREGVPAYKQFHVDVPAGAQAVRVTWQAIAGASFIGQPGPLRAPLDLALRHGQPIEFTYGNGVRMDLDHRVTPPLAEGVQTAVLAGDCLPAGGGRLHTLFLNTGADPAQIVRMNAEVLEALPLDGTPIIDCGGGGPTEGDAGLPAEDAGVPDAATGDAGVGDGGAPEADGGLDAGTADAG